MKHFELASGHTNEKVLEAAEELAKQGYYPVGGIFFDRAARTPYSMVMFNPLIDFKTREGIISGAALRVTADSTTAQDAPAKEQAPAIQDAPPATQQPYSDKSPKPAPAAADPAGGKAQKESTEVVSGKGGTSTKSGK